MWSSSFFHSIVACDSLLVQILAQLGAPLLLEELFGDLIVRFFGTQDRVARSRFQLQELVAFRSPQDLADVANLHLSEQVTQRRRELGLVHRPDQPAVRS